MTENEELKKAALQLKAMVICTNIKRHYSCSDCVNEKDCGKDEYNTDEVFAKSANIIFDALEELESYRAIGTVEELEARKKSTLSAMELADIWCILEDLKKYSAIGTIDEFKALKEKSVPKKPLDGGEVLEKICPTCGSFISKMNNPCYCPCGQKLDWSE